MLAGTPALAFDDFQTWWVGSGQYARAGKWRLGAAGEARLNDDSSFLWFARAAHTAQYRPGDRWSFDANLSYILGRVQDGPEQDILRVELAATPRWEIDDRTRLDLRTRLDYLIREGQGEEETLLRLRPRAVFPLGDASSGRALVTGNEFFYSDIPEKYFQNRFQPIGLVLPVGEARVELYTMIFSLRVEDDWRHDLVLGVNWSF